MSGEVIHLWLFSDLVKDGTPGREQVEVEIVGDDRYRLTWTPLTVLGFARDDVIRPPPPSAPSGYVLERWGGRIGFQFLMIERSYDDAAGVIDQALSELSGCLDHFRRHSLAGSVAVAAGHRATGRLLDGMTNRFVGCQWM